MNKTALVEKIRNQAKTTGIPANILYINYFFESFLKRVSQSSYHDYLILKGGFLLSALVGIKRRSTIDIDFSLTNQELKLNFIEVMVAQIIRIDLGDGVSFETGKISKIREEDIYGGFRVPLIAHLGNIRLPFAVDIATGDPVTPAVVNFNYAPMFGTESFVLLSYNIETVLAEKLHAILSRQAKNSRIKDYYDFYVISAFKKEDINESFLRAAVFNTFAHRNTIIDQKSSAMAIEIIKNDPTMQSRWATYSKRHYFAQGVSFDDAISAIKNTLSMVFK